MAELGDLKKHVDEAENLFRETEERHKHCRDRLISLIAAVENRLCDNRNELERNRAEYDKLTHSAEQLSEKLRQLQETLGNTAVEPAATVPRAIERAGGKSAPQAHTPDDPEKIRQGLRRALAKARTPNISTARVAAPSTESDG
jgi:chromosome segregation ATPase